MRCSCFGSAAFSAPSLFGDQFQLFVVEQNLARVRLLQQVDAAQEGTFAGATGADDADHIASRRFQGHALEHFVTAIAFMQVLDFKFVHAVGSHKNSQSVVEQAPVTQRFAPRHLGQPETGLGITQPFNGKQHPGRTSTHRADPIR